MALNDKASLDWMRKICKRCPGCGNFVQKTEGCDIMMCGTNAHGKVADALRNGGCACILVGRLSSLATMDMAIPG